MNEMHGSVVVMPAPPGLGNHPAFWVANFDPIEACKVVLRRCLKSFVLFEKVV